MPQVGDRSFLTCRLRLLDGGPLFPADLHARASVFFPRLLFSLYSLSLSIHCLSDMNRRPSYAAKTQDEVIHPRWAARSSSLQSSSLQTHRRSIGDPQIAPWSRTAPAFAAPHVFDFSAVHSSPSASETSSDDKDYMELHMEEVMGEPLPPDLTLKVNFSLPRDRRTLEHLLMAVLAGALIWTILFTNSAGNVVKTARLRVGASRVPLKSSVPLHSFRSNLKDGRGYVTSFPYGGLTNQLVEVFKLAHLGQRLDRVAVLPELKASRKDGGDVLLSTFFNLKEWSFKTEVSMVEWKSVKTADTSETEPEQLSCWGWRDEGALHRYNIKTNFWPPPGQLTIPSGAETAMTFPAIEVLESQPQTQWLTRSANKYYGSVANAPPFPDDQLLCFESLEHVTSTKFIKGQVDHSYSVDELAPDDPVWMNVGQHLRFSRHVNRLTDELIASLLGSATKPFIGVHIRQTESWPTGRTPATFLNAFDVATKVVQEELALRKTPSVVRLGRRKLLPVLFTTDSEDAIFVKKLTDLGWILIDHREFATATRFGGWYPGLLNSAVLSRAAGFVGTAKSSATIMAARRVESWNNGVTRIVG